MFLLDLKKKNVTFRENFLPKEGNKRNLYVRLSDMTKIIYNAGNNLANIYGIY